MPEKQSQATVSSLVASSLMAANMPVGKKFRSPTRTIFAEMYALTGMCC